MLVAIMFIGLVEAGGTRLLSLAINTLVLTCPTSVYLFLHFFASGLYLTFRFHFIHCMSGRKNCFSTDLFHRSSHKRLAGVSLWNTRLHPFLKGYLWVIANLKKMFLTVQTFLSGIKAHESTVLSFGIMHPFGFLTCLFLLPHWCSLSKFDYLDSGSCFRAWFRQTELRTIRKTESSCNHQQKTIIQTTTNPEDKLNL